MKNIYWLLFFLLPILGSCENVETIEIQNNNETGTSTTSIYLTVSDSLSNKLERVIQSINISSLTRGNGDINFSVIGYISSLSTKELETMVCTTESKNLIEEYHQYIDISMDAFFQEYSTDDFIWLRNSMYEYIDNGAHDINMLKKITNNCTKGRVLLLSYVCAYVDMLAERDFWLCHTNTRSVGDREWECRKAYRDKIALLALGSGVGDLLAISGLVVPELAVLEEAALIIDAGGESLEYYACVHGGIS